MSYNPVYKFYLKPGFKRRYVLFSRNLWKNPTSLTIVESKSNINRAKRG